MRSALTVQLPVAIPRILAVTAKRSPAGTPLTWVDPLETFRFAARAVAGSSEQNRQIGSNLGRFSPVRCCEPLWFYLRERFSAPTAGRSEFRCSGRLVVTQWPGNAFSARWLGGHRLFGDGRRRRCLSQGRGWRRRCFTQIRRCGRCGQFFHGTTGRTGPSTGVLCRTSSCGS